MLKIYLVLLLSLPFFQVHGIILTNCQLATYLVDAVPRIPWKDIQMYECIAHHASNYNTSFIEHTVIDDKIKNYGIFKIHNQIHCHEGDFNVNNCNMNCSQLLDADVTDDISCAQKIKAENDFKAWGEIHEKCLEIGDLTNYTSNCTFFESQYGPIKRSQNNSIHEFTIGDKNEELICKFSGIPLPELEWIYDKNAFPDLRLNNDSTTDPDQSNDTRTSTIGLIFPKVTDKTNGEFVCKAWNINGVSEIILHVRARKFINWVYIILGTLFGVIFLGFCTVFVHFYRKIGNIFSNDEIRDLINGRPELVNSQDFTIENSVYMPYSKKYEIRQSDYVIDEQEIIGSGQFGQVFLGKKSSNYEDLVAVKTVKNYADKIYVVALLTEIKIMIYIGQHLNIINFIGAYTRELNKGKVYMFLEYCSLGSLDKFLVNHRGLFDHNISTEENPFSGYDSRPLKNSEKNICLNDLYSWSIQIASGMEYLSSKKVIHGDLAARNILLDSKDVIKITDFGLSRKLYDYNNYFKKDTDIPLPFKWMALEALKELKFSTESDVWAYGITLWEIFTLGDIPYPGQNWSVNFLQMIEQGLRLEKPIYASNELYESVLLKCWELDPNCRPDFTQIYHFLREKMAKPNAIHYVQIHKNTENFDENYQSPDTL